MGASTQLDLSLRAFRTLAQQSGPPVAGKSQVVTMSASDQTITLEGGVTYKLATGAQPAYFGVADATIAGNRELLPANSQRFLTVPAGGLALHVLQAGTAGTLTATQLDDVW
jgi:hypothetical protein